MSHRIEVRVRKRRTYVISAIGSALVYASVQVAVLPIEVKYRYRHARSKSKKSLVIKVAPYEENVPMEAPIQAQEELPGARAVVRMIKPVQDGSSLPENPTFQQRWEILTPFTW